MLVLARRQGGSLIIGDGILDVDYNWQEKRGFLVPQESDEAFHSNLERVWAGALSFHLWNYAFWLYKVAALSVEFYMWLPRLAQLSHAHRLGQMKLLFYLGEHRIGNY